MVAEDQHFFDQQGVAVELKEFTAGKFALQAFIGRSLDFAVAGDVPVTLATLQGSQFRVLTQVVEHTTNEVRVVARRDPGATDPRTYFHKKRRRLATSFGGGPEFFSYVFLKKYGVASDEVEILSQRPEDMPGALTKGSVDAIAVFDPFAFVAEKQMGNDAITFTDSALYSELYVMTVRQETIDGNPDLAGKIIAALLNAQKFIEGNPEGSKQIVMKYTRLDRATVDGIWNNFSFAPALTQHLLDYQNQEAAWARSKGTIPASAPTPNFRARIYAQPLQTLQPAAVRLSQAGDK